MTSLKQTRARQKEIYRGNPILEIDEFPDHPFKVLMDEDMEQLKPGCAEAVLEKWGFKRTRFVLANTLAQEAPQYARQFGQENQDWCKSVYVPPDGKSNRYFAVDRGIGLTDAFSPRPAKHIRHWSCLGRNTATAVPWITKVRCWC